MWWHSLWDEGLHPLQWGAVLAGTLIAALTDIRTRRIPNTLTLPLLALGLMWAGWTGGRAGLADAATACLLLALPCLIMYLFAGGGAGDAKLMAALGAWLGVVHGLIVLVAVTLAGMVIAIGWAAARRQIVPVSNNVVAILMSRVGSLRSGGGVRCVSDQTVNTPQSMQRMPYGIAIFAGVCVWTLGVMLWPS